jgi:type IV fimbrial biogenesis protein FimT
MAVRSVKRAIGMRAPALGFGLIELVTVIAIIAVLTAIALPSFQTIVQRNRVVTDTNNLLTALNLARNEAVARGRPVSVCASTNGTACDGTGTDDWSAGWMVFTDYDPSGQVDVGSGDTVLRVFGPVATHDKLSSGGGNVGYVSFGRTGAAHFPDAASLEVFFTVQSVPCDNDRVRSISITNLGRSKSNESVCP